ncbi:MAG: hypothetical protein KBS35_00090 [Mycoplasma sp.]|nr:hypothetical protein [Candidatus Hennigella equi]
MKKILIPTLLTTSVAPIISLAGCGKQPAPEPVYPSDTFEWDFGLNGIFTGRVEPIETLPPQTQDEAMHKYLESAQIDPRAVVDDLLYADNLYYIAILSAYSELDLLQYKTKITVSDFDPVNDRFSIQLQRVMKILTKGTTSLVCDTAINLAIMNMPYHARYYYQNVGTLLVPIWEILPVYLSNDTDEMKARMKEISGWSITGSVTQKVGEEQTIDVQYDWDQQKIEDATHEQFSLLTEGYRGISGSYHFADVLVKGDYEFKPDALAQDTYISEVDLFNSDNKYKMFELDASDYPDFDYGPYTMTITSNGTPIDMGLIYYEKSGQCYSGYTSTTGKLELGILNKDTVLKLKLSTGSLSYENLKIEISPRS